MPENNYIDDTTLSDFRAYWSERSRTNRSLTCRSPNIQELLRTIPLDSRSYMTIPTTPAPPEPPMPVFPTIHQYIYITKDNYQLIIRGNSTMEEFRRWLDIKIAFHGITEPVNLADFLFLNRQRNVPLTIVEETSIGNGVGPSRMEHTRSEEGQAARNYGQTHSIPWSFNTVNRQEESVYGPIVERDNYANAVRSQILDMYPHGNWTTSDPISYDDLFDVYCPNTTRPWHPPSFIYDWFIKLPPNRYYLVKGPFATFIKYRSKLKELRSQEFTQTQIEDYFNNGHNFYFFESGCQLTEYIPHPSASTLIQRYDYRCSPEFFPDYHETKLFYGMELEVDAGSDNPEPNHEKIIREIGLDKDRDIYFKKDGSLHNGFEIVTMPGTWEYWRDRDMSFTKKLAAVGYEAYRTSTCGMHIHVERAKLSNDTLGNILVFMNQNQQFIIRASRRHVPHLLRWAKFAEGSMANLKAMPASKRLQVDKYYALNMKPDHTVEFRFFRGTISEVAIKRNLSLVVALCHWAKDRPEPDLVVPSLLKWINGPGIGVLGESYAKDLAKWCDAIVLSNVEGD